jgi:hypothetical protein
MSRQLVVSSILFVALVIAFLPMTASAQGWYLIEPPLNATGDLDAARPIAEWKPLRSFDSALACESTREDVTSDLRRREEPALNRMAMKIVRDKPADGAPTDEAREYEKILSARLRLQVSRCVSAADPRLAPKPSR